MASNWLGCCAPESLRSESSNDGDKRGRREVGVGAFARTSRVPGFASGGTDILPASSAVLKRSAVAAKWLGCVGPDSLSSESSMDAEATKHVFGTVCCTGVVPNAFLGFPLSRFFSLPSADLKSG